MFCRNCGAELPENAKFCRMCGEKLASATQPEPAPEPMTQAAPEPAAIPVTEQPAQSISDPVQPDHEPVAAQPYIPNYQQPMAQPYPQQYVPPVQPMNANVGNGKAAGLIAAFFGIFFICTLFIKTYAVGKLDYSVYTFIDTMSTTASRLNKNVFSFTADMVAESVWYSAPLYIALWVDLFFVLLAVIALLISFCRMVSNDVKSEYKMWGDIKLSVLFCFIGNFAVLASVLLGNIAFNIEHNRDIFEKWSMIPGVFTYVFLVLELIVCIVCGVWKRKAKKALRVMTQPEPVQALPPNNL